MITNLFLLVVAAMGILIASSIIQDTLVKRRLRRSGVVTEALIVNLRTEQFDGGRSNSSQNFVIYTFIPDGETQVQSMITGKQAFDQQRYEELKALNKIAIRYLPHNPNISRLDDTDLDYAELSGVIKLVFLGLGLLLLIIFVIAVR